MRMSARTRSTGGRSGWRCAFAFEGVRRPVEGNRLVLPKQGGDSASYLVTWER